MRPSMEPEMRWPAFIAGDELLVAGCSLSPAIAAAAALLEGSPPATPSETDSPSAPGGASPRGGARNRAGGACVAAVTLRFQHRAEWLRPGARLILRDRADGCIAGAGIVRSVLSEDRSAEDRTA